jgi:redox-sensitive bicupin YhaK (pirin superfamily)
MTILQVIGSRQRDLGGFVVRRVLPAGGRQMVGPFIFFDHLGPTQFAPGSGIDVRPHPHIALATVTYLFAGSLQHRDSLGTVQDIRPGDVNWMSAGSGIAHSERTPVAARASGEHVHGIQSWVALPDGHEDGEPTFEHHSASTLPTRMGDGIELTVIAGEAFGLRSPVVTLWPTLYVHAQIANGATLEVQADHAERAVYVVQGELTVQDELTAQHELTAQDELTAQGEPGVGELRVTEGQLAVLAPGTKVTLRGLGHTRAMLLGGAHFPTPRFIWWNFVASSQERIDRAKERWERQQFPGVPGESEFIPLPHY